MSLSKACAFSLVILFGMISPSICHAKGFISLPFFQLIMEHPLYQSFDFNSRRFIGTESQFKNLASLSTQLEQIRREIKRLREARQKKTISEVFSPANEKEEIFWENFSEDQLDLEKLARDEARVEKSLEEGAHTPDKSILPIIERISREILGPLEEEKGIILNELPIPITSKPQFFGANPYWQFFETGNQAFLEKYLAQSLSISQVFRHVRNPVLLNPEFEIFSEEQ